METNLKWVVIMCLLLLHRSKAQSKTTQYFLTSVSKDDLEQSPHETITGVNSELICSMMASRHQWPTLVCHEQNFCILSSLIVLPSDDDSSVVNPKRCFTSVTSINNCKVEDGTILSIGQPYTTMCDYYHCQTGGILYTEIVKPPENVTAVCPSSYVDKGDLGCLKLVPAYRQQLGFCDARYICHQEGADLVSVNMSNYENLATYLVEKGGNQEGLLWIGLQKTPSSDKWEWIRGGEVSSDSAFWSATRRPNFVGEWQCASTSGGNHSHYLRPTYCTELFGYVCQIPMF